MFPIIQSIQPKEVEMKKQQMTRAIVMAVTVALLFGVLPAQAFASSSLDRHGSSMAEYQVILDKANKEYGTEMWFITQADVDWAHTHAIELWGYLPEGGPRVTTLEVLQEYTLREFEFYARKDCSMAAAASRQEQGRPGEPYDDSAAIPAQESVSEPDVQSRNNGNNNPSRLTYIYYFPYEEYGTINATRVNGVFTWYDSSSAMYHTNEYNFYEFKYLYFWASNPGSVVLSNSNTKMTVTWWGYFYGYLNVTWTNRVATWQ
jgi:hypothetical protein